MDNHLKVSDRNKSGYWLVTTQRSYNGKWKALIPKGDGKMVLEKDGGGFFYDPKDAAYALKRYCINNGIKYNL